MQHNRISSLVELEDMTATRAPCDGSSNRVLRLVKNICDCGTENKENNIGLKADVLFVTQHLKKCKLQNLI